MGEVAVSRSSKHRKDCISDIEHKEKKKILARHGSWSTLFLKSSGAVITVVFSFFFF